MADSDKNSSLSTGLYKFNAALGTFSSDSLKEGEYVEDTLVIKDLVEQIFVKQFGMDVPDPATPIGRLVEWLAINFATAMRVNVQNANQLVLSAAAGQQLDAIALWFGLTRKPAVATTVKAILRGTKNTPVNAGSRARNTEGAVFSLAEDVTLDKPVQVNGSTVYQAEGTFIAVEDGPIGCPADTLNAIDTPTVGWTMVFNPEDAVVGRDTETDESLRARIEASRFHGRGFIYSMKNAIEAIDGVNSSMVVENYTGEEKTIHGIDRMAPHSIFVCVDCQEYEYESVAKAVFEQKPCGTAYHIPGGFDEDGVTPKDSNCHKVTVVDAYGNGYPVYIHTPEKSLINVNLVVRNRSYSGSDIKTTVEESVANWFASHAYGIGETVYAADIIRAVERDLPGVIVLGGGVSDGGTEGGVDPEEEPEINSYSGAVHVLAYQDVAASARAELGKVLITIG